MIEKIKRELSSFSKWDFVFMISLLVIIPLVSLYYGDSLVGIVSSLCGIYCVYLTGKGKLSSYFFGIINAVFYAWIAFNSKFYGDAMQNVFYYIPMQVVGFLVWRSHMDNETNEVVKKSMTVKKKIVWIIGTLICTFLYGLFLKHLGGNLPFVDSFTTVGSILAMVLQVLMYAEQWTLWVIVDIFGVYMWIVDFLNGSTNMATLLMWILYLILGVVMLVRWLKESRKEN